MERYLYPLIIGWSDNQFSGGGWFNNTINWLVLMVVSVSPTNSAKVGSFGLLAGSCDMVKMEVGLLLLFD